MRDRDRVTALLADAEAAGVTLRPEAGQLHITTPKSAKPIAALVALAKAAVLARLAGRTLPADACPRCGNQPTYLAATYWGLPLCPPCCHQLAEPGGEFDLSGTWPETPPEWERPESPPDDALAAPDGVSRLEMARSGGGA